MGKRCPIRAAVPVNNPISGEIVFPMITDMNPLTPSKIKTKKASDFDPVLRTLVAPIFPEPMVLTSPIPEILVSINPKGIEPAR